MSFCREKISDYTYDTQQGVMWEWNEEIDGSKNRFFVDHWIKVKKVRNFPNRETKIDHPLTEKKVVIDGRELGVQSVHKMWDCGFYLTILYYTECEPTEFFPEGGRSHGSFLFENINSHNPWIIKEIEKNKNRIKI